MWEWLARDQQEKPGAAWREVELWRTRKSGRIRCYKNHLGISAFPSQRDILLGHRGWLSLVNNIRFMCNISFLISKDWTRPTVIYTGAYRLNSVNLPEKFHTRFYTFTHATNVSLSLSLSLSLSFSLSLFSSFAKHLSSRSFKSLYRPHKRTPAAH